MNDASVLMVALGALLLVGLATDYLGRKTFLPRVTLLILFGVFIGPSFFNVIPPTFQEAFPFLTNMALAMVGFLIGGKLEWKTFRKHGKAVILTSLLVISFTALLVFAGLGLMGAPLALALLLAGISCATAPASTMDVVEEGRAKGRFTDTLIGIVALDDVWALIVFSLLLVFAHAAGGALGEGEWLYRALREIIGSLALGALLGIPSAYLTGRLRAGEPTLVEALGVVFLACGLALWLEFSYILCCVVLGIVVVNTARHHERPFHAIENIELPFMILFFVLSGASMKIQEFYQVPWIMAVFIAFRILGRICGGWLGGLACGSGREIRTWMGIALLPQAGVSIGMALHASQQFPGLSETLLPTVLGATVIFEILGPVLTKYALVKAGEYRG